MLDPNPKVLEVQTLSVSIWNPTPREQQRLRRLAQTINSNKGPGLKRATVIAVPKSETSSD